MKLEIKTLISSRLFGELIRSEEPGFKYRLDYLNWYERLRNNFDDFLKQQLAIWMFVPCKFVEGVWVVLEEPKEENFYFDGFFNFSLFEIAKKEYQEAKDRVLFEWFNIDKEFPNLIMHKSGWSLSKRDLHRCTVETYANNGYNLELTPTAQKQIGLI